jgi:8-oxo-dGTP pyrophosphatase MutT (NUDIX family)
MQRAYHGRSTGNGVAGLIKERADVARVVTQAAASVSRVQYAALPYRVDGSARTEIMLITSRERRRWIIPKGWPHKGRPPHRSAAREAFEEAGVVGKVRRRPVGTFSYRKRHKNGSFTVCEVRVFALRVRRQSRKWPEKNEREFQWLPAARAAKQVKDPHLGEIILRVAGIKSAPARGAKNTSRRVAA